MSALSRIPGVAQLAALLAATFSLNANPTLRRYNDALSQTFYHHGRLCASNQATVMVLVIVFVGLISYPGIVTSYNLSPYARQKSASTLLSSRELSNSAWPPGDHQSSSRGSRSQGDLDAFWTDKVLAPTWVQDSDSSDRGFPLSEPLHYIAPFIINATDYMSSITNSATEDSASDSAASAASVPLSAEDLLRYAAQIQQRIDTIVVEYSTDDREQPHFDKAPRLLSIRDICVLNPSLSTDEKEIHSGCLVHFPQQVSPHHDRDLFGDLLFDEEVSQEQRQTALVVTYFLRGDLERHSASDGSNRHSTRSQDRSAEDGGTVGVSVDVRRVWRLIFHKLVTDLQAERAQQEMSNYNSDTLDVFSVAEENMVPIQAATLAFAQDRADNLDEPTEASSHPPLSGAMLSPFAVRVLPGMDTSKKISRRLVPEESMQLRSNISAEYWLLAMAYFVMFLYISLSVGRVDLVKSKYGLGIAAVATVFVSLLMSIGLCSVFGVTLTLMPWEILPFMIIVVGVENINILVHAVVETSMDLPVRERVGRGLGSVGVSITLTLVAELSLLIVGAMTTIPAVQEFCTFAIAAVIMDYLLQMTFFITVISIDIRRLELSDLSTRPTVPYLRYPFGPRHASLKASYVPGEAEGSRFGVGHTGSGLFHGESGRSRHHRSESAASHHSDDDGKSNGKHVKGNPKGRMFTSILMVGVMAYLGYIYGTTNQTIQGDRDPIDVSYWRVSSPEASQEFWSTIDPNHTGSYLEIEAPVVVALMRPSNSTAYYTICHDLPDFINVDDCETTQDLSTEPRTGIDFEAPTHMDGQLDPRRPFKLVWDALVFSCLFAIWLVRVFMIPSMVFAASILLLLSYLLSPQRKLLVDLQWRFPFIVLPGDYQSKRKLMMEELLAQEARESGLDPRPSAPLPGAVETLHQSGHRTDIDQMDVSADKSLILTSSMDGIILLWDGAAGSGQELPLAQLEEGVRAIRTPLTPSLQSAAPKTQRPKTRPVKFLRLAASGEFAVAGYADGCVHVWRLHPNVRLSQNQWSNTVPKLMSATELVRRSESTADVSRLRLSGACFWERPLTSSGHAVGVDMMVGYRDGQIWQWDLTTGKGRCIIESNHRGGISELTVVELDPKTRQDLGLQSKAYLVVAGRDGGIQCWSSSRAAHDNKDTWTLLWGHSGLGAGVGITVLSVDTEVPMVAAGYTTGAIKVWDLEQGNLVWTLSRGLTTGSRSTSTHHSNRQPQGHVDNHQPSHQSDITKLCFHPLELEDGLTGEPAPRVWLVISSSADETVMVWMVEWEGLMCLPTPLNHSGRLGQDAGAATATRRPGATSRANSFNADRPARLLHTLSPGLEDSLIDSSSINALEHGEFSNTLSSSLPAPRLVGFMKQKGGKSMTVSNTCLYGVRRSESTATTPSTGDSGVPKQSHASIDSSKPSSTIIPSRRKSDSHGLSSSTATGQDQATAGSSSSSSRMKRGWELWEADLYQCIFKDPGVWGLDLTVRAINLQPPQSAHRGGSCRPPSMGANAYDPLSGVQDSGCGSGAIMVSSNGSSMAVPVAHQETRPKLQRKPGSYTHQQSGQRGYVFTTGLAMSSQPQANVSTTIATGASNEYDPFASTVQTAVSATKTGSGENNHSSWTTGTMSLLDVQESVDRSWHETMQPVLLPFVETKLMHSISRRGSGGARALQQQQQQYSGYDAGEVEREPDMRDIVVGFGNFIKIVRLHGDEEEEEEEETGRW
ncbi:hypothetical protein BGZ98_008576 [Dissophora globulifera]|nr:hypothetical protein BGZ98_008576 [Dissophora globulifera]